MKTSLAGLLILTTCGFPRSALATPQRAAPADTAPPTVVLNTETPVATDAQDTSRQGRVTPPPDFIAVTQQPAVIRKVNPVYPDLARRAGMEGTVYVKMWIDTTGVPHDAQIVKSDQVIFNQSALDAAAQFLFTPARLDSRPVAVWVAVPFNFRLAKDTSEAKSLTEPATGAGLGALIDSLLSGDRSPRVRSAIHPDARYIEGSKELRLRDVLFGNENRWLIDREKGRRGMHYPYGTFQLDENGSSGYIIITTENGKGTDRRVHSLYFARTPGGALVVRLWHVST